MKKEPMAGTRLPATVVRGLKAIEQVEGIRPLDNGKKTPISGNTRLEAAPLFAPVWQRQAHPSTCRTWGASLTPGNDGLCQKQENRGTVRP